MSPKLDLVRPQPAPPSPGKPGPRRILVVDDNIDVRIMLEHFFRAYGYAISVCKDGNEALALLHGGGPFDLVVLDLMMPGCSGYDVLRELRRNEAGPREIPIIILTAVETPFVSGVQAIFRKPAPLMELLASVQSFIGPGTGSPDASGPPST